MRNDNCRKVLREIEEAAPGELLSSSVKDHMRNCAACEKVSREQSRLQQIVSSLGTVEAPGDFDFRLRARLAGEKPGSANAFSALSIGRLSFGLPSAAVAAMLLLVGLAFVFVSLKSESPKAVAVAPGQTSESAPSKETTKPGATDVTAKAGQNQPTGALGSDSVSSGTGRTPVKRQSPRIEMASLGGKHGGGVLDSSSKGAPVLTPDNQLVGTYPTAAFSIDTSYQSLKVSVDNGRGASRTISLPTVSFGSNQSLSQDGALAANRGAW